MAKDKRRQDPLADLLAGASPEVLADLIVQSASTVANERRQPFRFPTKDHSSIVSIQRRAVVTVVRSTPR